MPRPVADAQTLGAISDAILRAADAARIGLSVNRLEPGRAEYVYLNEAAAQILGRPRDWLVENNVNAIDLIAPELREGLREALARRLRGEGNEALLETTIEREDGRRVPVQFATCAIVLDGKPATVAFFFDVTSQREAERARRASEEVFRRLIEAAPDGIVVSRDGVALYANPEALRMLGCTSPDEVVGRPMTDFLSPAEAAVAAERISAVEKGATLAPRTYAGRRRDGGTVYAEITSLPLEWEGAPAIIGFARDVTEREAMSARLARADRLAAAGALAAGVAHEVNNPLAFMMLRLEELARVVGELGDDDRKRAAARVLADVREGGDRIAAIVRDLGVFSRDGGRDREDPIADLRDVVTSAERLAAHELRRRAAVSVELAHLPLVRGTARALEQVVVNLLLNAAHAFDDTRPGNRVAVRGSVQDDGRVLLEVTDNGVGIPPEHVNRVFDPFFTTKPEGTGSGLGLWVSHGIVERFGGELCVESRPGVGTTFRVRLLAAEGARPVRAPEPAVTPRAPSRLRVLVVDDEPLVGRSIQTLLKTDHDVVLVGSGGAALELLIRDREDFDVILTDLSMPGVSGVDLCDRLAAERPGLESRVVLMTGGATTTRARDFLARVPNHCLEKPFAFADLQAALADAVARRGQPA